MSKRSASTKWDSSRFADPNMRNTRSSGSRSTSLIAPWLRDAAWRHPDRRDPAGELVERLHPRGFPPSDRVELRRMGQQCPDRSRDRLAGLVLTPTDRELDVGSSLRLGHARLEHHAQKRRVGHAAHDRQHVVDRLVDRGGRFVASRLDSGITAVVGDAGDHRLRPLVHLLVAGVRETGHRLQALGRERQREDLDEIGAVGAFERA